MGRTEPSLGRPPPEFRRDARAKKAKATVNKLIPALLNAHPRARRGIDSAELILDPAPTAGKTTWPAAQREAKQSEPDARSSGKPKGKGKRGKGRGRKDDDGEPAPAERTAANPAPGPDLHPEKLRSNHNTDAGITDLRPPRIRLAIADTLTVARYLLESEDHDTNGNHATAVTNIKKRPDLANATARVGILNMASPLSPGGGFLNGAMAQEESLCMRSTLLPSLKDEFYRLPELGAVYTPDVLVFRDETGADLEKRDRWFVDCVSAAMLRFPEVEEIPDSDLDQAAHVSRDGSESDDGSGGDGDDDDDDESDDTLEAPVLKRYVNQKDRDAVLHKMRVVMRIFKAKGCRKIVLGGTWGCGAYGNPVGEVAAAWRKVLHPPQLSPGHKNSSRAKPQKENWHGIDEIVFAIKGGGMASRFEDAFLGSSAAHPPATTDGARSHTSRPENAEGQAVLEHIDPKLLEPFSSLASRRQNSHSGTGDGPGEELDAEESRMRELRGRIATLELQAKQARSEQLRNGLLTVLAGLKSQMPPSQLEDSDERGGLHGVNDGDGGGYGEDADGGSDDGSFVHLDHERNMTDEEGFEDDDEDENRE